MNLRIRPLHLVALVFVLGLQAWATSFAFISTLPGWLKGGAWIGGVSVQSAANNKLTTSAATGTFTIGDLVLDAGTFWDSSTQTATGAVALDVCELAQNSTTTDGGTAFSDVTYSCYAVTDGVKLRIANPAAGNRTVAGQSFRARTFSNQ